MADRTDATSRLPSREELLDLPKVELHVHIEGSIRPETLLKLAQRHGRALPADSVEGLREGLYRFTDFEHFIRTYVLVSSCVRTAEDVELVAYEFALGQAEHNVVYTEATWTALTLKNGGQTIEGQGIPWDEQRDALASGFARAREETGAEVRLVLDICRDFPEAWGEENLAWTLEGHKSGLVAAMGLSGREGVVPVARHRAVFAAAKAAGVPVTSHAGENEGPASIREVLEDSFADRIGHGVRCVEDVRLVRELAERRTPLEVCPTSNVALGVYPSLEKHSLPFLLDAGLVVTINSDDPPMFGTTITDELYRVSQTFGLDKDALYSLSMNAANAAFVSDERRQELRDILRENWYSDGG